MRVLVTGADGFVGRTLVARLAAEGHEVIAGVRPGGAALTSGSIGAWQGTVRPLELADAESVQGIMVDAPEAVVHLAAVASNRAASAEPDAAWQVNVTGTARLLRAALAQRDAGGPDPLVLQVSSGEVYGPGADRPRREDDPCLPVTAYAASKLAAEVAAGTAARSEGLRLIIARPFTHTGPGQPDTFVVPAFARRIRAALLEGRDRVPVGNLHPVRDLLDVRDVVEAYLALLRAGEPGQTYNVASGTGHGLRTIFDGLARALGARVEPEPDPELIRRADVPHLVGDPARLVAATGWRPTHSIEQTLADVIHAQAH